MAASINYWILLGFPAAVALACVTFFIAWGVYRARRAPFVALVRGAEAHLHAENVAQGREQDSWPF